MAAAAVGGWAEAVSCMFCVMRRCRWFKWLHATHACAASKAWAVSQGMEVEEVVGEGGQQEEEEEGGAACVVS